jgi:hypothetical protein
MRTRCGRIGRRLAGVATAAMIGLGSTGSAAAQPAGPERPHVRGLQEIAGVSPYVGRDCNVPTDPWLEPGGQVAEPIIAVDPHKPRHRVAAWMDRTRASMVTAYTFDGGRTWTKSVPQGLDSCGGNHQDNWEASGDPWVSVGADGTSYFSSLVWAHFATPPLSAYRSITHTVTSFDGGNSWTPPALVGKFNATSDKDMILADRSRPGVVYDAWRNASFGLPVPAENGKSELLFSRSTDYGRSWAPQTVVATVPYSTIYGDPQLAELANGTLVYTTGLASAHGAPQILAFRSIT